MKQTMKQTLSIIIAATIGLIAGGLLWSSQGSTQNIHQSAASIELSKELQNLQQSEELPEELLSLLTTLSQFVEQQKNHNVATNENLASLKETVDNLAINEVTTLLDTAAEIETDAKPEIFGNSESVIVSQQQRLTNVGFADQEAQAIVAAIDKATLARLDLRYQAAREGWSGRQMREEAAKIPNTREFVREEFGEDAYDRYLYATGQPNRVNVQSTLSGSVAESVGLQAGDTIIALDNKRVYNTSDILRIASSGDAGESVPLTYKRGTQTIDVYVPRGPIGFNGGRAFADPDD